MNSPTYKNLLRLLEKWPLDSTKKGRDLGEHIRQLITSSFGGVASKPTEKLNTWEEIHSGLRRIANDRYKIAYTVRNPSTATGLTEQQCQQIISNELLEIFEKEDEGFFKRNFNFKRSSSSS